LIERSGAYELGKRGRRAPHVGIALAFIHVVACLAFVPAFFSWSAFLVACALCYLTGAIGICLGYHRLLTHRSVAFWRPVEYAIATLGVLALQGGPVDWIATHRVHHAFSDTESDPHDSRRGFMWCHVGWLCGRNPARPSQTQMERFAPDIAADPYYRFLERTPLLWQIALGLVLFACGGWAWVVWGVFARLVVVYNVTWLVNSAAHLFGYRTYRTPGRDRSMNNWLVAGLAWGEGWHNNHHAFPFSARHGLRWWEFDATWWTIRALSFARIAHSVKLPTAEAMALHRLALAPEAAAESGS
jgi:stearoyl-CoA desaturase (delta-9 desaturase)